MSFRGALSAVQGLRSLRSGLAGGVQVPHTGSLHLWVPSRHYGLVCPNRTTWWSFRSPLAPGKVVQWAVSTLWEPGTYCNRSGSCTGCRAPSTCWLVPIPPGQMKSEPQAPKQRQGSLPLWGSGQKWNSHISLRKLLTSCGYRKIYVFQ